MSKTNSLFHIVFATKRRSMTIPESQKRELYRYILGINRSLNCFLIRINGIPNHIHILVDLNPMTALADYVKKIKQSTSKWLKENPAFPDFEGWGEGYYAFSLGIGQKPACIEYIDGQVGHHMECRIEQELEWLALKHEVAHHVNDLR